MLYDSTLFESLGCLLFLCRAGYYSPQLNIYEMRDGDSRWSTKFLINLADIKRLLFPEETWSMPNVNGCCFDVWSIILGKRKEDSYLVTGCYGKVVLCRFEFEKENVRTLSHYGSDRPHYGFQFIAGLIYVPYVIPSLQ
ncbi:hypothetical protein Tco_0406814 [Tanacetum coccineum]